MESWERRGEEREEVLYVEPVVKGSFVPPVEERDED